MKIKCVSATIASGEALEPGKTYDVSDKDARLLCNIGKAELVGKKDTKQKGLDSGNTGTVKKASAKK